MQRTTRGLLAALIALAVFAGHGPSRAADSGLLGVAGTSPYVPGKIYVGVGSTGGIYNLPDFEANDRFDGAANALDRPFSYEPMVQVAGPGATFGYVLPQGTLPAWAGTNVRVEISGTFWFGDTTDTDIFNGQTGVLTNNVAIPTLDGTTVFDITMAGDSSVLETDYRAFEISLRIASDFEVGSNLHFTPSIAFFAGQSTEEYTLAYDIFGPGALLFPGAINQENKTTRYGGEIGGALTYTATEAVRIVVATRVGLMGMSTKMTGDDCRGAVISVAGTPCADVPVIQTTVTDKATKFGARLSFSAAVTYDFGWAAVVVGGFGIWESAVPGIRNPSVNGNLTATSTAPASIKYDSQFHYGGLVTVVVPLN